MTEVAPADRTRLLQSKRAECISIARSRKRKLRELFAVATTVDGLPNFSFDHLDAPPTDPTEIKFLEGCDILQGRKLNELSIPPRLRARLAVPQSIVAASSISNETPTLPAAPKQVRIDASRQTSQPTINGHAAAPPAPQRPITTPTPRPSQPVSTPAIKNEGPASSAHSAGQTPSLGSGKQPEAQAPAEPHPRTIGSIAAHGKPLPSAAPSPSQRPTPYEQNAVASTAQHHVGAAPPSRPGGQGGFDASSRPDQMDANHLERTAAKDHGGLSLQTNHETPRPMDALSSPESTAHTATTPAVLETSTNTSPDRDGLRTDEKPEAGRSEPNPLQRGNVVEPSGSMGSTSKELEAQLLRDSVNAARFGDTSSSKSNPVKGKAAPHGSISQSSQLTTTATVPELGVASAKTGSLKPIFSGQTPRDAVKATGRQIAQRLDHEDQIKSQDQLAVQPPSPTKTDRAVTRVSSGAIRQKSVSEILSGDASTTLTIPGKSESDLRSQIPITPTSQSPRPRARSLTDRSRPKEKSKLSGVVFGRQSRSISESNNSLVSSKSKSSGHLPADDYFTPLFIQGFSSNGTKWMRPLDQILHHAHKTISTPDSFTQILDNQSCKILKRVYDLQRADKWSLRQPKRCPEPPRQASHWDVLLKEMKWMRTDFRKERKWKSAVARNLADACAEWIALDMRPEDRRELQVRAVIPDYPPKPRWENGNLFWDQDVNMNGNDADAVENHGTPDLISSADADSPMDHDEDPNDHFLDSVPPSAIFTLHDDEVVFGLNSSPSTDRLLEELPLYGSPLKVPESDLTIPRADPDAHWRREALPLSKYVEGRLELKSVGSPRKRSRYQYAQEDDDDEEALFETPDYPSPLGPQNPGVALFQFENKPMRDRLHAGHQFRPPNEHAMPFQSFYESRSCSQWTMAEDDELKALVREYSYNWSLISTMLSTKSHFTSAAERRTPWECFERWVMLEGLPHDMQRTQYFKLWQNRIDSAQAVIRQQNQTALTQAPQQGPQQPPAQPQPQSQPPPQSQPQSQSQTQSQSQPTANGSVTPIIRRRLSLPVKVERRRNQKHLTMIDAFRKLAKKRETALQKQQHAASLAQMRKQQEQPQQRVGPIKTPREYSIMRWERDQAMAERLAERMAQQQQRVEAQRRVRPAVQGPANSANPQVQAALQARAQQGQAAQMASAQNPQVPQTAAQMGATHPLNNVNRANAANHLAANSQARPRMPMPGTPNGTGAQGPVPSGLVPPMQMNANGQVQMPVVNGQARMTIPTQPDLNLVLQAQRISEQQRQAVQMRQAQQQTHTPHQGSPALQNSPPAAAMRAAVANGVNQKNYMNNAQAIMASFNGANNPGMSTTPPAGLNMPVGQSGSPRPNPPPMTPQIHQTFVSQLQHIESQIRQTHPNTPQDVVRQMATQLLQNRHNNLAQSAMNAAAGNQGQTAIANGPHQYAQLLRAQQQAQAAAAANAQAAQQQAHQRNSSAGSATPPVPTMPK